MFNYTASKRHASERINTKFNLPADRVKIFFDSYHGLAGSYGSTLAANCASCHGYQKILPSTDVNSTIHRTNLVATCGKCHPGANEIFPLSKIHVDLGADQNGNGMGNQINWWVVTSESHGKIRCEFPKKTEGRIRTPQVTCL